MHRNVTNYLDLQFVCYAFYSLLCQVLFWYICYDFLWCLMTCYSCKLRISVSGTHRNVMKYFDFD